MFERLIVSRVARVNEGRHGALVEGAVREDLLAELVFSDRGGAEGGHGGKVG